MRLSPPARKTPSPVLPMTEQSLISTCWPWTRSRARRSRQPRRARRPTTSRQRGPHRATPRIRGSRPAARRAADHDRLARLAAEVQAIRTPPAGRPRSSTSTTVPGLIPFASALCRAAADLQGCGPAAAAVKSAVSALFHLREQFPRKLPRLRSPRGRLAWRAAGQILRCMRFSSLRGPPSN